MDEDTLRDACYDVLTFEMEKLTTRQEVTKAALALAVNARYTMRDALAPEYMIAQLSAWVLTRTLTDRRFRVSVRYPKTWVDHLFLWLGWKSKVRWIEKSTVVTAEIKEAYPQCKLPMLPKDQLGKPIQFSKLRWPDECWPQNYRTSAQMEIEEVGS